MSENNNAPGGDQPREGEKTTRLCHNSIAAPLSQAMLAHGLTCPPNLEPGKYHRFPGAGKAADNLAGWLMPFDDGTGAVFGDWSNGISEVFRP